MKGSRDDRKCFWRPVLVIAGAHFLCVLLAILWLLQSILHEAQPDALTVADATSSFAFNLLVTLCAPCLFIGGILGMHGFIVLLPLNSLLYGVVLWLPLRWMRGRGSSPGGGGTRPKGTDAIQSKSEVQ